MASLYTRAARREKLLLAAAERTKKGTSIPAPKGEGAGASGENANKSKAIFKLVGEVGLEPTKA
jgi:hypothetical protein